MIAPDILEGFLREAFQDADLTIVDLAGDNDHYRVEIAAKEFLGKSLIAQHKMVYDALQGKVGGELHALSLKTRVKEF